MHTGRVGCAVVYFRLLVPWMLSLTVRSHFGIPFSQHTEYPKAGVESLVCHHPEEWNAAERSHASTRELAGLQWFSCCSQMLTWAERGSSSAQTS